MAQFKKGDYTKLKMIEAVLNSGFTAIKTANNTDNSAIVE